jgi:hypothetical protein
MGMLADRIGSEVKEKKMQNGKHLNLLIHKLPKACVERKSYIMKCDLSVYYSAETGSLSFLQVYVGLLKLT